MLVSLVKNSCNPIIRGHLKNNSKLRSSLPANKINDFNYRGIQTFEKGEIQNYVGL